MRIGTYNILGMTGFPPAAAREALGGPETFATTQHFARIFRGMNCDILGLQEGVSHNQIQRVRDELGPEFRAVTFPSPVNWPGHLLTRYPVQESRVFSHAASDAEAGLFSRTAGAARLEVEGQALWVLVLHLHPNLPERWAAEGERVRSLAAELLRDTEKVLVMGDFNCPLTESVHSQLKELGFVNAMEEVGGGIAATMDTAGVTTRFIDHIYVSSSLAPLLSGTAVIRDAGFRADALEPGGWVHSDHLPVIATLEIG